MANSKEYSIVESGATYTLMKIDSGQLSDNHLTCGNISGEK